VQEAGGIVSDFWGQGKEYFEKNVTYVSGNKSAHLYIVEKINNT
jgi:myo-inositol-1(or 4)-monophosphatase